MEYYYFKNTARSERFFVSTLLCHCLMNNNFEGLKKLFVKLLGDSECGDLAEDFEIVSELDPIRDGSIQSKDVRKIYQEFKRIAVPDLFLRWDNQCIILEAKFFTSPSEDELISQVDAQRDAIEKVKKYTRYKNMNFNYVVLTLDRSQIDKIIAVTWEEIVDLIKDLNEYSKDMVYSIKVIECAVERAIQELRHEGKKIAYTRLNSIDELLSKTSKLIDEGIIYVGFTGGIEALNQSDYVSLKERSHYKISDIKWSDSWITIDNLIRRYLEVTGLKKANYVD